MEIKRNLGERRVKTLKTILWTLAAVFVMILALAWYGNSLECSNMKTAEKQDVTPKPEASPIAANPQTPRERCAEAMAKLSVQAFNIECEPLRKEEIYEAKKLANQINPNVNVIIDDESETSKIEEKKQVDYGPTLGLTFADVSKGFDEFGMTFELAPLAGGERRMVASSDSTKAISTLEVIGDPDNVNRVSLMTGAVKNPSVNLGNIACMVILLNNTVPEWDGRGKWLEAAIQKVSKAKTSEKAKQEIIQGDKKLELSLIKESGVYFLTVQHKDHKESD
jgi:hypothetical protein